MESSLDLFETAIGSVLVSDITLVDPGRITIGFSHGFSDILEGSGFTVDGDGRIISGTITRIAEYRNNVLQFVISDLAIPAQSLTTWIAEGDYQTVMLTLLSGSDLVTGSDRVDRIFTSDGNDTVRAGADNDEVGGEAGDDHLYGGAGDDSLDGGSGIDLAYYDDLFSRYALRFTDHGLELAGPVSDGDDTLSGIEQLHFRDGVLTIDHEAVGSRIIRLYDAVLHRAPGQVELEGWLDRAAKGMNLEQVAAYFLDSAEFKAAGATVGPDSAFVDFLYRHALGREAELTGRAYWTGQLAGGLSRADALLFFSESAEHKDRTADQTATGYFQTDEGYQTIALLYDSFADRLPDTAGLMHWGDQLNGGTRSLSEIASLFVISPEFQGRTGSMSHAQLVDFMYRNTLGREADPGGRAGWIAALDGGMTDGDLLLGFALSAEHQLLMSTYITGGIDVLF
ncbi:DUF4214 domain-containing protein [Sphingomonas sp.]|uniref:DUF4214 domain-containing protein n=1 Tax=Sphingomonas sp. TaxID=28214 RepID=UPI002D7F6C98|nr:DUF4214 domain-containing protein [Sphingomonas sp.]HEU0043412.1 DUF4214 domain-containing protein [Sphingomonas sp.]